MRQVLFICTGNYYRSRFAEAVFNHAAAARGLPWRAFSRGLATHLVDGAGDLSIYTRFALAARGIPLHHTGNKPVSLTATDLERASVTIALKEAEHRAMMEAKFPAWADRIEYWHFHDLDASTPDVTIPAIERAALATLETVSAPGAVQPAHPFET